MDEEKVATAEKPQQKKQEPRRQRREKVVAVKLFNKLLFDFVNYEAQNTTEKKGFLNIPERVNEKAEKLNAQWRIFCAHAKNNNKKRLSYKPDILNEEMQKHIERHKNQVWTKHLKETLQNAYGINTPVNVAGSYYNRDKTPEETAKTIFQSLQTMYKIQIPDIRFTKEIPEDMNELTESQFIHFAGLVLRLYQKEIEVYDLKTSMAMKMLGVKYSEKEYTRLNGEARAKISENVHGLTELLNYFFEEKEGKLKVNTAFTRNLVPELKIKHRPMLKGPADALTDVTFLEYKDANTAYRTYLENEQEDDLNELIAILYRPYRIPFVPDKWRKNHPWLAVKFKYKAWNLAKRKKQVARLPLQTRFAIFLNYMAFEDYLRTGTVRVDGKPVELKILYETTLKEKQLAEKQKYNVDTGLAGIAMALASSGIFGPLKEVYAQNLYDVIMLLVKQRIEFLNQLENIKK